MNFAGACKASGGVARTDVASTGYEANLDVANTSYERTLMWRVEAHQIFSGFGSPGQVTR